VKSINAAVGTRAMAGVMPVDENFVKTSVRKVYFQYQ
jgi:hypothetical protein